MSDVTPSSSRELFQSERGPLRPLSPEEILAYADLIHQQERWQRVLDFARTCYDSAATTVIIDSSLGEYNDNGGTDFYIESVIVKDANGTVLDLDLTSSYWDTEQRYSYTRKATISLREFAHEGIKSYSGKLSVEDQQDYTFDTFLEYISEDNYNRFDLPYDKDGGVETYDLTASPMQQAHFPTLYVAVTATEAKEGETA